MDCFYVALCFPCATLATCQAISVDRSDQAPELNVGLACSLLCLSPLLPCLAGIIALNTQARVAEAYNIDVSEDVDGACAASGEFTCCVACCPLVTCCVPCCILHRAIATIRVMRENHVMTIFSAAQAASSSYVTFSPRTGTASVAPLPPGATVLATHAGQLSMTTQGKPGNPSSGSGGAAIAASSSATRYRDVTDGSSGSPHSARRVVPAQRAHTSDSDAATEADAESVAMPAIKTSQMSSLEACMAEAILDTEAERLKQQQAPLGGIGGGASATAGSKPKTVHLGAATQCSVGTVSSAVIAADAKPVAMSALKKTQVSSLEACMAEAILDTEAERLRQAPPQLIQSPLQQERPLDIHSRRWLAPRMPLPLVPHNPLAGSRADELSRQPCLQLQRPPSAHPELRNVSVAAAVTPTLPALKGNDDSIPPREVQHGELPASFGAVTDGRCVDTGAHSEQRSGKWVHPTTGIVIPPLPFKQLRRDETADTQPPGSLRTRGGGAVRRGGVSRDAADVLSIHAVRRLSQHSLRDGDTAPSSMHDADDIAAAYRSAAHPGNGYADPVVRESMGNDGDTGDGNAPVGLDSLLVTLSGSPQCTPGARPPMLLAARPSAPLATTDADACFRVRRGAAEQSPGLSPPQTPPPAPPHEAWGDSYVSSAPRRRKPIPPSSAGPAPKGHSTAPGSPTPTGGVKPSLAQSLGADFHTRPVTEPAIADGGQPALASTIAPPGQRASTAEARSRQKDQAPRRSQAEAPESH